ncbi:hypothetical protein [Bordetella pertussis]|uniref:hypothetical protein n=1 Tax=Bordetella pertussis TaxID=520 RepID=UPI00138AF60B|nr:hypothetical protein [Bordetella pertussis]
MASNTCRSTRGAPCGDSIARISSSDRPPAWPSCEDSIGCMHGSSEPDLRNCNLDEYNLLTVHT